MWSSYLPVVRYAEAHGPGGSGVTAGLGGMTTSCTVTCPHTANRQPPTYRSPPPALAECPRAGHLGSLLGPRTAA